MTIAVFLDRDGTLNQEVGYIRDVEKLQLIPGAAQAVRALNDAGILAILVSNQSGPARGYYDEDHVKALHQRLVKLLDQEAEARLDALYYCPHLPNGIVEAYTRQCSCRKPETALIQEACKRFPHIELSRSYVIGDKATDIELAHNVPCHGILLKTGYGDRVLEGTYQTIPEQPFRVCKDIQEAVSSILNDVHSVVNH